MLVFVSLVNSSGPHPWNGTNTPRDWILLHHLTVKTTPTTKLSTGPFHLGNPSTESLSPQASVVANWQSKLSSPPPHLKALHTMPTKQVYQLVARVFHGRKRPMPSMSVGEVQERAWSTNPEATAPDVSDQKKNEALKNSQVPAVCSHTGHFLTHQGHSGPALRRRESFNFFSYAIYYFIYLFIYLYPCFLKTIIYSQTGWSEKESWIRNSYSLTIAFTLFDFEK